jgi:hypothetical protein
MIAREFEQMLKQSPFVAFTLQMNDGAEIRIRHSDYCLLSPTKMSAHIYTNDEGDFVIISLEAITRITSTEPMASSP